MICERCNKEYSEDYRRNNKTLSRFCSRACANSRFRDEAYKKRISEIMKKSEAVIAGNLERVGKYRKERLEKSCPICGKKMYLTEAEARNKIYCSRACFNTVAGGYREGSVKNHKHGTYKGFYYDSSWELIWIKYALNNGIVFERNTEGFPYIYKGAAHKYYPDFYLPEEDRYVEIKGYKSTQWEAKKAAFPYKLEVISKKEIEYLRSSADIDP